MVILHEMNGFRLHALSGCMVVAVLPGRFGSLRQGAISLS